MAVRPIEKILNNAENREAYNQLSNNFHDLVPYIGTGLSYYFKSWKKPFEIIYNNIKNSRATKNCFLKELDHQEQERAKKALCSFGELEEKATLFEYIKQLIGFINTQCDKEEQITADWSCCNEKKIWEGIKTILENDHYLAFAEILNLISFTIMDTTFNRKFLTLIESKSGGAHKKLEQDSNNTKNLSAIGNKAPLPQAVWFVPYVGGKNLFAITTNTDDTLQYVYKACIDTVPFQFSGKSYTTDVNSNTGRGMIVFHIHGVQPQSGIDSSESFIMTWSDYRKAYHAPENTLSRLLLSKYFCDHHLLFLGASLLKDDTVQLMKHQAQERHAINRHVAFFGDKTTIDKNNRNANTLDENMATLSLITDDFNNYSPILCQLIREERTSSWGVIKKIVENNNRCSKLRQNKISAFLNGKQLFDIYKEELQETDLDTEIYPAIKDHVYDEKGNQRTFKWAVCRIDQDSFCFPVKCDNTQNKVFLDTYSAPLGNTIYIIGGSGCTDMQTDELITKIQSWCENHAREYWQHNTKVKVRIFLVNNYGALPPESIEARIKEALNQPDDKDTISMLQSLIMEMKEYAVYHILLSEKDLLCVSMRDCTLEEIIRIIMNIISGNMFRIFLDEQRIREIEDRIREKTQGKVHALIKRLDD